MQVKVSKHVDAAGKIYLPYLHEWAHPQSDLVGLVQICIVTFSEQPPVYAKPKQPAGLPYPMQPQGGGYPGSQPGYPAYPPQPQGGGGGYPPYPPTTGGGYPQPQPVGRQDSMTGTVTAEHLTASIRSAVEDKVRRGLREQVEEKNAEMQVLKRTGEELSQGQSRLKELVERMKREE